MTFSTPLKNLDAFVSAILMNNGGFEKGVITIDQIVFEPKKLNAFLAADSHNFQLNHDCSIEAEGEVQVRELLRVTLSEWIDFLFVPTPKPFVLYADHDEYTTFYANTKSNLNQVVQPLLKNCFKQIPNYQREL